MANSLAGDSAARWSGRVARRMPWQQLTRDPVGAIFMLGLGLVLCLLVAVPLLTLLFFSFRSAGPADADGTFTLDNYARTFLNPATYQLLGNTAIFAVGSVALGLALGTAFAWLVERTNTPLRSFAFVIVVATAAIPSILFAMSWVFLLNARTGLLNLPFHALFGWSQGPFGPYSFATLIIVEGLRLVPTVFLMMVGLFRSMDPSLEEAAATAGARRSTTLRRITLPILLPGLLGVAIFVGTATIGLFEIPAVLGMPGGIHVFATRVYLAATRVPRDYGLATSLGTVAALFGLLGVLVYHRVLRVQERFTTVTGKGYRVRRIDLGRWRYLGAAAIIAYFTLAVLLPVLVLFWASVQPFYRPPSIEAFQQISFEAYRQVLNSAGFQAAVRNSLTLIAVVPAATILLSALISWIVVRTRTPGKSALDAVTFLPFTVPGIVFGLAYLLMALYVQAVPLYGTIWIVALAHVALFLAYGSRSTSAAMYQLHRELEEAARVSGLPWLTVFRKVTLRLLAPALVAAWLWVAIHSGRELTIALMLAGSENQIISVLIWSAWENGRANQAAAMGILLILLVVGLAAAVRLLTLRLSREAA